MALVVVMHILGVNECVRKVFPLMTSLQEADIYSDPNPTAGETQWKKKTLIKHRNAFQRQSDAIRMAIHLPAIIVFIHFAFKNSVSSYIFVIQFVFSFPLNVFCCQIFHKPPGVSLLT